LSPEINMDTRIRWITFFTVVNSIVSFSLHAQGNNNYLVNLVNVDSGWASTSINTVVFRKNSLVTWKNYQFIAYYDAEKNVVLGKRKTGADVWEIRRTKYKGHPEDAHNSISIMADGDGYLHMTWDHHNDPLNYCKSKSPGSMEMSDKILMTGKNEQRVTYPEFYKLKNGNLLFFYRNGESGKGNLILNRYDVQTKQWTQLHDNLIDGEGTRNAYWQACTDNKGNIHLSWVWRESPDVASNHDLCYAYSNDEGKTWLTSSNKKYELPVTAASAEYICRIPQNSDLINQTSMVAGAAGGLYIASYWRDKEDSIPQYHVVYKDGKDWQVKKLNFHKTKFSLSGGGTKRIPISRPQLISWLSYNKIHLALFFRDEERGNKVSVAVANDILSDQWEIKDLAGVAVNAWEPSYDTELWQQKQVINLFVQKTEQGDGEKQVTTPSQMVKVLEWKPL